MVLPRYLLRLALAPLAGSALATALRLTTAGIVGIFVWAAHTWLVVVGNEGTWPSDPFLAQILALPQAWYLVTGTAFWTASAWLGASVVGRVFTRGPVRLVTELVGLPVWIYGAVARTTSAGALPGPSSARSAGAGPWPWRWASAASSRSRGARTPSRWG